MNKLSVDEQVKIVACLVEGNSLRSTVRITGIHRTTIQNLLVDLGTVCSDYQDKAFRNLKLTKLQCDEIWAFVGCKQKNTTPESRSKNQWGDVWTWTALDSKTKLVPCWYVGTRDASSANHFLHDLRSRVTGRIQLTTDGHGPYKAAVEDAFGSEIDYAQLVKIYGVQEEKRVPSEIRYSPAQCMGARKAIISGKPQYAQAAQVFFCKIVLHETEG